MTTAFTQGRRREQALSLLTAEPGLNTAEVSRRLGMSARQLLMSLQEDGCAKSWVEPLACGGRPQRRWKATGLPVPPPAERRVAVPVRRQKQFSTSALASAWQP